MCNFRCFITKKGEKTSWRTGVTAVLLWPRGFKNLNMHDSTCVCVLYNISEVCVCDDSLPVDPQGLEWEQVYCSVSQPCQDTRTHRASHVHLSPPLISLCLFLYFALSLFTSPTYLQSLFLSSILTCLFLVLFSSPPSAPKWVKSHDALHILLHLHSLPVPEPHQMSSGYCVGSFTPVRNTGTVIIVVPLCFINGTVRIY